MLEHNQLKQAIQQAYDARRLAQLSGDRHVTIRCNYLLGHINRIAQQWDESIALFQKILQQAGGYNTSIFQQAAYCGSAQVYVEQGNLETARAILQNEFGFLSVDTLNPVYILEYRVLARMLIADGKREEALDLLLRLHSLTYPNQLGLALEIQILLSTSLLAMGLEQEAIAIIHPAMRLGRTEGYLRTFLNDIDSTSGCLVAVQKSEYRSRLCISSP